MRDMFRFIYLVPIVIVLGIFFISIGGGSDIDLEAGPGIVIDQTGEDFEISAPGSTALQFRDSILPPAPAAPTLSITSDATIDVGLNLLGSGESAQYHLEVDVPALQTAVGAAIVTQVWDPRRQDPGGIANAGYEALDKLRIEAALPITLGTVYDDTDDTMRFTLQLDGGTDGQVITSTGPSSNPAYEDLDLSVTGRTDTQLEVASTAAGTNATIPSASTTEAGLMSGADKIKVDGLGRRRCYKGTFTTSHRLPTQLLTSGLKGLSHWAIRGGLPWGIYLFSSLPHLCRTPLLWRTSESTARHPTGES